jgi:hypothetical protein
MSRISIARRGAGAILAAGCAATALAAAPASADAAPSQVCIPAPKQTKYLSTLNPIGLDHSWAKLTWSPEVCPNGAGWRFFGDPVLTETGAGSAAGVGINLEAPSRTGSSVSYRGQVRGCLPVGAGYGGISYTGKLCNTLANGEFSVRIDPRGNVSYQFPNLRRTGLSFPLTWTWTNSVI